MKAAIGMLIAMTSFATPALADEQGYSFECDATAGYFSYRKLTVSSGDVEVTGKITVNGLLEDKDKKWSPGAQVFFRSGKEKPLRYGLRIYATPEVLFLELLKVGGREKIGLGSIPRNQEPIPFTLRIDSGGLLKATVAGAEASANLEVG